jgi:protein-L-isoaspartate(D-aspartate) O-methyltransferase
MPFRGRFPRHCYGFEEEPIYLQRRNAMVKQTIEDRGIRDPKVLEAMLTVPRHEFVPDDLKEYAYEDRPLPIGVGQTISQPYIVAYMTELLELESEAKVLEMVLAPGIKLLFGGICQRSHTIEIFKELGQQAQKCFERLGYDTIQYRLATDTMVGGFAPYDWHYCYLCCRSISSRP